MRYWNEARTESVVGDRGGSFRAIGSKRERNARMFRRVGRGEVALWNWELRRSELWGAPVSGLLVYLTTMREVAVLQ